MRGYAIRKRFYKKGFNRWCKSITLLVFFFVVIRLAVSFGADTLADSFLAKIVADENIAGLILRVELGAGSSGEPSEVKSMLIDSSYFKNAQHLPMQASESFERPFPDSADGTPGSTAPEAADGNTADALEGSLFYGGGSPGDEAPAEPSPPVWSPHGSASGIEIENGAGYEIDASKLLQEPLSFEPEKDKPSVLIIHTHSSEAYTPGDGDKYEASDPYRTENKSQSIIRIGDELTKELKDRGIKVIHDRESYDFPSYSGSYARSYTAIESYLKKYPSIKMVLDIHRDAISAADGSQYKTIAHIGDTVCSQVMMVVGTDASGLTHPGWRENLKLAVKLQNEMNTLYPTLTRPIRLSQYRYNQQATAGSLIIEVGCAGNTLRESLAAVKYFAEAAANVILPQ